MSPVSGLKVGLLGLSEHFTEDELRDLLMSYLSQSDGLPQMKTYNPELFKTFCLEKIRNDRLNQILGENDEST